MDTKSCFQWLLYRSRLSRALNNFNFKTHHAKGKVGGGGTRGRTESLQKTKMRSPRSFSRDWGQNVSDEMISRAVQPPNQSVSPLASSS